MGQLGHEGERLGVENVSEGVSAHQINRTPRCHEQFYGRRVGRGGTALKLLATETFRNIALSAGEIEAKHNALRALFRKPVSEVWLEVGFGGGEHMLAQLQANPHVGIVGVEPYLDGVARVLRSVMNPTMVAPMAMLNVQSNVGRLTENQASADLTDMQARLRVVTEDVRHVMGLFKDESFGKIFVLFSDPWPKMRHHKRRLIQAAFVERCAQLLAPGGELVLAHDHAEYIESIWEVLQAQRTLVYRQGITSPAPPWPAWPADLPMTRYGQKALASCKPLAVFIWQKETHTGSSI